MSEFGALALLGGTGPQGRGLARPVRGSRGIKVVIRSREATRAGAAASAISGSESGLANAFHDVSAVNLEDESREQMRTNVPVSGDDHEATDLVEELASAVPGMRGVYGGRLRNAHQVEALTANLISNSRRNRSTPAPASPTSSWQ